MGLISESIVKKLTWPKAEHYYKVHDNFTGSEAKLEAYRKPKKKTPTVLRWFPDVSSQATDGTKYKHLTR